jgi:hypothetical protein
MGVKIWQRIKEKIKINKVPAAAASPAVRADKAEKKGAGNPAPQEAKEAAEDKLF